MIPLRYIDLTKVDIPPAPKKGVLMPLERALVLVLLDAELKYYPIDVARIAAGYCEPIYDESERQKIIANARRGYAELAKSAGMSSNPQMTGTQWTSVLRAGLGPIAALMAELKILMEQNPGVVYALADNEIVPHPNQQVELGPPAPPKFRRFRPRRESHEEEMPSDQLGMPEEAELGTERLPISERLPNVSGPAAATSEKADTDAPLPQAQTNTMAGLPKVGGEQSREKLAARLSLWFFPDWVRRYRWALGFLVLLGLLVLWFLPDGLDRVKLSDIQEIAEPKISNAFFLAHGKHYIIGDRVRFEGKVGEIREIHRDRIIVSDEVYLAPQLVFFDTDIMIEGNAVVYPGSPRHIAGNFWISDVEELDQYPEGYISWIGDYRYLAKTSICSAVQFLERVSGRKMTCHGDAQIVVPHNIQIDEFFVQCELEGAKITKTGSDMEIMW